MLKESVKGYEQLRAVEIYYKITLQKVYHDKKILLSFYEYTPSLILDNNEHF